MVRMARRETDFEQCEHTSMVQCHLWDVRKQNGVEGGGNGSVVGGTHSALTQFGKCKSRDTFKCLRDMDCASLHVNISWLAWALLGQVIPHLLDSRVVRGGRFGDKEKITNLLAGETVIDLRVDVMNVTFVFQFMDERDKQRSLEAVLIQF